MTKNKPIEIQTEIENILQSEFQKMLEKYETNIILRMMNDKEITKQNFKIEELIKKISQEDLS